MAHKVVIIDDEPWTRGVILKLGQWNQLGLEVVGEAADGETGLELIYKVLPDIIITDFVCPELAVWSWFRNYGSKVTTPLF